MPERITLTPEEIATLVLLGYMQRPCGLTGFATCLFNNIHFYKSNEHIYTRDAVILELLGHK